VRGKTEKSAKPEIRDLLDEVRLRSHAKRDGHSQDHCCFQIDESFSAVLKSTGQRARHIISYSTKWSILAVPLPDNLAGSSRRAAGIRSHI
jgi:hypothetical protein